MAGVGQYCETGNPYAVNELGKDRAETEGFFNQKNYIIMATVGGVIMGVVTSAIVAIFTRAKK